MSVQIDSNEVGMTDEPANSVGTSPSSDSGIHSLGEQWEDISVTTTDAEEEQNRTTRIYTLTQRCGIDTYVPTDTEEDNVMICPPMDGLSNQKSDESPEIDMLDSDSDSEGNESEELYSDQELTNGRIVVCGITKRGLIIRKHVGYAGSSRPAGYVKPT